MLQLSQLNLRPRPGLGVLSENVEIRAVQSASLDLHDIFEAARRNQLIDNDGVGAKSPRQCGSSAIPEPRKVVRRAALNQAIRTSEPAVSASAASAQGFSASRAFSPQATRSRRDLGDVLKFGESSRYGAVRGAQRIFLVTVIFSARAERQISRARVSAHGGYCCRGVDIAVMRGTGNRRGDLGQLRLGDPEHLTLIAE